MTHAIGRPQSNEAIPFQLNYINQVEGDDLFFTLETQLPEGLAFFNTYTEETSLQPYAPGKWTMRQTLGHITDAERIFTFRALWLARSLDAPLPGFDQDCAVASADSDAISWAAHLDEFTQVRRATLALFHHFPAAAWMRTGTVSDSPVTVRALAFVTAGHVAHHLRILRESSR
jgi:hypothetical protein